MSNADVERQNRLTWIKQRELAKLSFIEIVNNYNATFGTRHFAEILGIPELVREDQKALPDADTPAKKYVKKVNTILFGNEEGQW